MIASNEQVVALIREHFGEVNVSSNDVKVRCPYHAGGRERTPSLVIALDKNLWYCHACKKGGLLQTLLSNLSGKEITLPKVRLKRRPDTGLDGALLSLFDQLPDNELTGFSQRQVRRAGVRYDSYRKRIVYPIRDINWTLVGVMGRLSDDELKEKKYRVGKYKKYAIKEWDHNYVFHKSDHLWPLHLEYRRLLLRPRPVVIVEGFKAALWVRSAGFLSYATMTSRLSKNQAKLLLRFAPEVTIWYDWDDAGLSGTFAAVKQLYPATRVRVVDFPEQVQGEQPDDFSFAKVVELISTAPRYVGRT